MARKPKFSRKPLFFKIMFGDFSEKLRIPPNFVKNFNGKPPAKSVLRDCSGRSWNVEVKQGPNGFLFFQNGWQYFVNDNSLEMGDLLIYQYDGNSYFDVTIFDKSGCEKVGDLLHKRMNLNGHMLTENRTKEKPAKCIQVCQFRYLTNLSDSTNSGNKPYRRTNKAVFEAASCPLKLKNPHFCMTWKRQGLRLVPSIFARETGLSSKSVRILHLKDPNGRLSSLRLSHWTDGRCHFGTGQRNFGVVSELATGDTCVFELIGQNSRQKGAYQFQVHIIRAGKTSCSCSDCALMRGKSWAGEAAEPAKGEGKASTHSVEWQSVI